eukprot:COSAG01_NODE_765_length_13738_cov_21.521870_5_plen_74_part_00
MRDLPFLPRRQRMQHHLHVYLIIKDTTGVVLAGAGYQIQRLWRSCVSYSARVVRNEATSGTLAPRAAKYEWQR